LSGTATEDQRHEASLERRSDCRRARDCRARLGAAYGPRCGRSGPEPAGSRGSRALFAAVQSAAEPFSGCALPTTTGRSGSRSAGDVVGDAAGTSACAGGQGQNGGKGWAHAAHRQHGRPAQSRGTPASAGRQLRQPACSPASSTRREAAVSWREVSTPPSNDRGAPPPCLRFSQRGLCSSRRIPPAREPFHIGEQIAQASICDISDPRKGAQKAVGARQLK